MPGAERLTKSMPDDVQGYLDAADEDLEAEEIANSVNGDLHLLIDEARHFAAVLYGSSTLP